MAERTTIGWTVSPTGEPGHTFNGWFGCEHAQLPDGTAHAGCSNCYAEHGYGTRYGVKWGPAHLGGTRKLAALTTWNKLLQLARRAAMLGVVERVFMFSLGDVLEQVFVPPSTDWEGWPKDWSPEERAKMIDHARQVDADVRYARTLLWDYIRVTAVVCGGCGGTRRDHVAATRIHAKTCNMAGPKCRGAKTGGLLPLLLSKRVAHANTEVPEDVRPLCALGGSISDQASADAILPELVKAKGFALLFVSAEPLVGRVDLEHIRTRGDSGGAGAPWWVLRNVLTGDVGTEDHKGTKIWHAPIDGRRRTVDWVIIGGESGRGDKPRPFHLEHAANLAGQVRRAGLPLFVKQMGSRPVMAEAAWKALQPRPMLSAASARHLVGAVGASNVPLLFTGKGEDPAEWHRLFNVDAEHAAQLQQVPIIIRKGESTVSSSNVKPITVRVVGADGEDLGPVTTRPTGGNWRVLTGRPSIRVGDRTAACEWDGKGWVLKLKPGESKPGSRKGAA